MYRERKNETKGQHNMLLRDVINSFRYRRLTKKMAKMTMRDQRAIARSMYDVAYDCLRKSTDQGEHYGSCTVLFECDIENHVRHFTEGLLLRRSINSTDPTCGFYVDRVSDTNEYSVTVISKATDEETAMLLADACAMSAVLKNTTAHGSFSRFLGSVDSCGNEVARLIGESVLNHKNNAKDEDKD